MGRETLAKIRIEGLMMFAMVLLSVLMLTAAATDLVRHRIYNWTTYPGMIAAFLLSIAGWGWELISPETAAVGRTWVGWIDLSDCLVGFFACGLLMLVCFVFFPTGGGDVKLLAMVGAFVGIQQGLEVLLWTFVLGGCVGLTLLVWQVGLWSLLKRGGQLVWGVLTLGIWLRPGTAVEQTTALPVFLGPCAAAALVAVWLPSLR